MRSLPCSLLALLVACGAPLPETHEAPSTPPAPGAVAEAPEEPTTASAAPAQDGAGAEPAAPAEPPPLEGCRIEPADGEGLKMVLSDEHDWYMPVPEESPVACSGNVAQAKLQPGLVARMIALPASKTPHEEQLRDFLVSLSAGLQQELGLDAAPEFERRQLGDAARLGQCTSIEGNVKNDAVHLVACVTTVRNRKQETLLHSLTWVLPAEDFGAREGEVWEAVANLSSAWFRVSDLNARGTLRHGW